MGSLHAFCPQAGLSANGVISALHGSISIGRLPGMLSSLAGARRRKRSGSGKKAAAAAAVVALLLLGQEKSVGLAHGSVSRELVGPWNQISQLVIAPRRSDALPA